MKFVATICCVLDGVRAVALGEVLLGEVLLGPCGWLLPSCQLQFFFGVCLPLRVLLGSTFCLYRDGGGEGRSGLADQAAGPEA